MKTLPAWGQALGCAAELPLSAELDLSASSAGDLVTGPIRTASPTRARSSVSQQPVG